MTLLILLLLLLLLLFRHMIVELNTCTYINMKQDICIYIFFASYTLNLLFLTFNYNFEFNRIIITVITT
jgi:hypothetical protein